MIRLMVFDLDNTLAELGKGIVGEDLILLKKIENLGVDIAVCSGKPTYYLCGFMRQVGLKRPILVGENGAVIQFGVDLPPREFYVLPYSEDAKNTLSFLKKKIEEVLPDIWFQPNLAGVTPFPATKEEFDTITKCLEEEKESETLKYIVIVILLIWFREELIRRVECRHWENYWTSSRKKPLPSVME